MTLKDLWTTCFSLIELVTGNVDVTNKGDLQTQVDNLSDTVSDCFQSVSDGKKSVANAITGKGVSTAVDATFATMATNIGKIKTTPTLQSKSASLHTGATSVTMKPDSGYDGLSQATAAITLQEKTATLSTAAQSITPDSGKVLSKVTVPAVTGTAGTGDVLSGKTFSSGSAGVNKTGAMANRGAWVGETSGNGNVAIPKGYHDGNGYVKGEGAYNAGKSAGTSAAKVGTAGTGDVLSGKTFTNASTVGATGAMANKGGTTVDAGSVTKDSSYTYLGIPSSGYYSSGSKVRAKNSDLASKVYYVGGRATSNGSTNADVSAAAVAVDLTNISTLAANLVRYSSISKWRLYVWSYDGTFNSGDQVITTSDTGVSNSISVNVSSLSGMYFIGLFGKGSGTVSRLVGKISLS